MGISGCQWQPPRQARVFGAGSCVNFDARPLCTKVGDDGLFRIDRCADAGRPAVGRVGRESELHDDARGFVGGAGQVREDREQIGLPFAQSRDQIGRRR